LPIITRLGHGPSLPKAGRRTESRFAKTGNPEMQEIDAAAPDSRKQRYFHRPENEPQSTGSRFFTGD
jgi:hypothetical protein